MRAGARGRSQRGFMAAIIAPALLFAMTMTLLPQTSGASADAAPSLNVSPQGSSVGGATRFGVSDAESSRLSDPLPADQRFNMQNFLPSAETTALSAEQARIAGYDFLRSLITPSQLPAVGQSPNRDYAQIQRQLAEQQKQQDAALMGQGDLSAVLFGLDPGSTEPLVEGVNYLTSAQVNAITGWHTAKASWYGPGFYGNQTADGTLYTETILLVAHKTLPLGTKVAISYNGRTVVVPVKDRGPYIEGRDFDLSNGLATALGFSGVQTIRWAIVL